MKKFLATIGILAVAMVLQPMTGNAGEGWCGGTDTKTCCSNHGNAGACSCVCIPGNCYCGPRLSAPSGSESFSPDADLSLVEQEVVVKRTRITKRDLDRMAGGRAAISARPGAPAGIGTGECCAKVGGACISWCNNPGGCTGDGDCDLRLTTRQAPARSMSVPETAEPPATRLRQEQ